MCAAGRRETEARVIDTSIIFGSSRCDLEPAPIRQNWILEGNPVARNRYLSVSADREARTCIWDCTAGRFNWFYDTDETVYVIEGAGKVYGMAGAEKAQAAILFNFAGKNGPAPAPRKTE